MRHLRHDAWEVEHFSSDVGQVAVQEDKQWLNDPDVVCETRGEGSYKSQEDADEHPANSHHEEVRDARKHVDGVDGFHLAERLEQVVQDLGKTRKHTTIGPSGARDMSVEKCWSHTSVSIICLNSQYSRKFRVGMEAWL